MGESVVFARRAEPIDQGAVIDHRLLDCSTMITIQRFTVASKMTSSQYNLGVLVLVLCLSMASGRGGRGGHGRGGHHGRGGKNGKACKMFNVTSGTEVFPEKTCGCDGETTIACNLGPLTYDKRCAGKLQATFCNIDPDWTKPFPWKGILAKACLVQAVAEGGQIYKVTPCHTGMTCDATNSLTLTVNGTAAVANFCSRPALTEDDNDRPCRPRTPPTFVETCVSLEESQRRPHSSHPKGFKFGGRKGHPGGTGRQGGGGGYGKYKGGRRGGRRGN